MSKPRNALQQAPETAVTPSDGMTDDWRQRVDLIKRMVAKGATDDELDMFVYRSKQLGLDPLSGQIHFIKRRAFNSGTKTYEEVGTIQIGIDGLMLIAQRTGLLVGVKRDVLFDKDGKLEAAWAEVKRNDWEEPIREVVYFDEYCQRKEDGKAMGLWARMPKQQLKKCALAAALRLAFPHELGGVYAPEELDQSSGLYEPRQALPPQETGERVEPAPKKQAERPDNGRRREAYEKMKGMELSIDEMKRLIGERCQGKESTKELTGPELEDLIAYLEKLETGEEIWWPPIDPGEQAELDDAAEDSMDVREEALPWN